MVKKFSAFLLFLAQAAFSWQLAGSGNLPRPILFVHGINATMVTWGVSQAQKICTAPSVSLLSGINGVINPDQISLKQRILCADASTRDADISYTYQLTSTTQSYTCLGCFPDIQAVNKAFLSLPREVTFNFVPEGQTSRKKVVVTWWLEGIVNGKLKFSYKLPYVLNYHPNGEQCDATVPCGNNEVFPIYSPAGVTWDNTLKKFFISSDPSAALADTRTEWTNMEYAPLGDSWKSGYVKVYKDKAISPPAFIASFYGFTAANKTYTYPGTANQGINHNGLEFFTATASSASQAYVDKPDEFCRPDKSNGIVYNTPLKKYEYGQTNQLFDRVSAVLTEYYPDWKTNFDTQIDIVCHSQGCLVTRSLVANYRSASADNPANHIRSITSLNSPALGSGIATDGSKIPSVASLRTTVYNLYRSGLLDPMKVKVLGFKLFTIDLFKAYREMAANFIFTDQYLAYPNNLSTTSWDPPLSAMRQDPVTVGRSDFTSSLVASGYPTRPYDRMSIPLTAYYGTVPGAMRKYQDLLIQKATSLCHTSLIPFLPGSFVDVNSVTWWGTIGFSTCMDWVNYVNGQVGPLVNGLDAEWSGYSDLIVDVGSQKYEGFANGLARPFTAKALAPTVSGEIGVPHFTLPWIGANGGDLAGATTHGAEILQAINNPPGPFGMSATYAPLLAPRR
jgi:hypothetical protein